MESAHTGSRRRRRRAIRPGNALVVAAVCLLLEVILHLPFLTLPYFGDEVRSFVRPALGFYRGANFFTQPGAPLLSLPLVGLWTIFSTAPPVARGLMLLIAASLAAAGFVLAVRLARGTTGLPALLALLFLLAAPILYTHGLLVQPDTFAALLVALTLLFYLEDRFKAALLCACGLPFLSPATVAAPLALAVFELAARRRARAAAWLLPILLLAAWGGVLQWQTGLFFAPTDQGVVFESGAPLHRLAVAAARLPFFLFADNFHWIGTLAILAALFRRTLWGRSWLVAGSVALAVALAAVVFGGPVAERRLIPVLPVFYIAAATAIVSLPGWLRWPAAGALSAGLVAGLFYAIPFLPIPLENNLAFVDAVQLHREAARYLQAQYPGKRVLAPPPFSQALADPALGYLPRAMQVLEYETGEGVDELLQLARQANAGALVLASRDRGWAPPLPEELLRRGRVQAEARRILGALPDPVEDLPTNAGFKRIRTFERRGGLWLTIYARE